MQAKNVYDRKILGNVLITRGKVFTWFSGPKLQSTSPALVRTLYFCEGVTAERAGEKLPGENGVLGVPFNPVSLLLTGLKEGHFCYENV